MAGELAETLLIEFAEHGPLCARLCDQELLRLVPYDTVVTPT